MKTKYLGVFIVMLATTLVAQAKIEFSFGVGSGHHDGRSWSRWSDRDRYYDRHHRDYYESHYYHHDRDYYPAQLIGGLFAGILAHQAVQNNTYTYYQNPRHSGASIMAITNDTLYPLEVVIHSADDNRVTKASSINAGGIRKLSVGQDYRIGKVGDEMVIRSSKWANNEYVVVPFDGTGGVAVQDSVYLKNGKIAQLEVSLEWNGYWRVAITQY